jgi:small subunit ribosomal protein S3Ae
MAIGKNKKKITKKGKRSKKDQDPFTKKDWYDVKAPNVFTNRLIGKTLVTRSSGKRNAHDFLKGRVFEANLADLNKDEDKAFRKMKFRVDDIVGKNCLTNFHGMDMTTDRLRFLIRKWQSTITAQVNVKTTDGYMLRMFCIGFTKRRPNQIKKTCYAQTSQIRRIRRKMIDIMTKEASTVDLKDLVNKFIPEAIGQRIEKECQWIFPLQNVLIRKVKLLKMPKFDQNKLLEIHGDTVATAETGTTIDTTTTA